MNLTIRQRRDVSAPRKPLPGGSIPAFFVAPFDPLDRRAPRLHVLQSPAGAAAVINTMHRGTPGVIPRLGNMLREKLLNRSSEAYLSYLTGGDRYWNEAVQVLNRIQAETLDVPHDYYQQAQPSGPSPSETSGRSGGEH